MDAFFAAVEQKRHPELLGKAVVIGGMGDPTRRGVVATASYEARLFGIHSAMPLKTAYRLKPEAVFLPVDYEAYMVESRKVKQILRNISPIMEDVGIDEAFLDISALNQTSLEIAEEIKSRIHAVTGLDLFHRHRAKQAAGQNGVRYEKAGWSHPDRTGGYRNVALAASGPEALGCRPENGNTFAGKRHCMCGRFGCAKSGHLKRPVR